MPGLDFQRLRSEITMAEVLELLGFVATNGSGDQLYGPCPLHTVSGERQLRRVHGCKLASTGHGHGGV